MDPFRTPPLLPLSLPSGNSYIQLSKHAVLQLIDDIPFKEVSVPKSLVNDDPESIVDFFTEFGLALVDALIRNSPQKASPRKVLHRQFPLQSVRADPETPTKPRQSPDLPDPQRWHEGQGQDARLRELHAPADHRGVRARCARRAESGL